ncbi:MAG: YXWGXW repeat-containing protein [Hyphomicrobiaceae bacterium]|nr:YXWGXW repeat-containing protein [Hyphomicrobiaceae bacterium]
MLAPSILAYQFHDYRLKTEWVDGHWKWTGRKYEWVDAYPRRP